MPFRSALLLLTSFLAPVAQAPPLPPITVDKIADDFPARRVLTTGDCYTRGTPFSTGARADALINELKP